MQLIASLLFAFSPVFGLSLGPLLNIDSVDDYKLQKYHYIYVRQGFTANLAK